MANPLQKRKARSNNKRSKPTPTRTAHHRGLTKRGKRKVDFLGNEVIARNWERGETLVQNYRRMGLVGKLGGATGGVERNRIVKGQGGLGESVHGTTVKKERIRVGQVRVVREEGSGRILRVVRDGDDEDEDDGDEGGEGKDPLAYATRQKRFARMAEAMADDLSDPESLNDAASFASLSSDEHDEDNQQHPYPSTTPNDSSETPIPAQLEAQASLEMENLARTRKPRYSSKREAEWIARLVEKYGDDYRGMVRDRRLNPMQQSEGDLRGRIGKWKAGS